MEAVLPGAPAAIQGGVVGLLLLLVLAFVVAILRGSLEPRATSKRVENVMEKRYASLREAYLTSEAARAEALEVAKESLEVSRASLAALEELKRAVL